MTERSLLSDDTTHAICRHAAAAGMDAADVLGVVEELVRAGVLSAPTSAALSPAATARVGLKSLARTAGLDVAVDDDETP